MKQSKDAETAKPKLVGMNHVALEVGDVDAALAFYGKIFDFSLRGRSRTQAFIDMGDQFIALMATKSPHRDRSRHFGVVVDDRSRVVELAKAAGAKMVDGPFLDFLDPWGNRIEVIEYANIQFTKAPHVLRGMGLALGKTKKALGELAAKGMAPRPAKARRQTAVRKG
ncbi:MAG: VOC family protein [Proteobacteria bacterium]|nr:VOC family protein [Pseudomonadota bacterium]MBI3497797.1 VOC family protein [Pseudomonadota bacterium]